MKLHKPLTQKQVEDIVFYYLENEPKKEDIKFYFISEDKQTFIYSNLETEKIKIFNCFFGVLRTYNFYDFENDLELLEELEYLLNYFCYRESYIEQIKKEYFEYIEKRGF